MTYGTKAPEAKRVLDAMSPGQVESPSDLAKRFGTSAAIVRQVLEQLATAGTLTRVRCPRVRYPNYILTGTEVGLVAREKYVGVPAAPRTYVVMTGNLDGYMSEIRQRADLCMMVRR